jgi:predicted nucleic acid-binding protein
VTYADTSFLLRLLTNESGAAAAMAAYRRFGTPRLVFGPLHELEVRNGLRLKAWMEQQGAGAVQARRIATLQTEWERRLQRHLACGSFLAKSWDWEEVASRAEQLSAQHTVSLGARAFDVLHVAHALVLHCKEFFTCDARQAKLAKLAGLKVIAVSTRD